MSPVSPAVPTTLLVGNPRAGSRTFSIAEQLVKTLIVALAEEGVDAEQPRVVDLAEIGPALPARVSRRVRLDTDVEQALQSVRRPGLLIVASPTYKGSYSGLLKLFLDMLPIDGLAGTVAVAAMTAGWPQHRGAGETHLRPLLLELGAMAPVPGLSLLEDEFPDAATAIGSWVGAHAPVLAAVIGRLNRRDETCHPVRHAGALT